MNSSEAKSAILESIRQNLAASLPFDEVHREHQPHQKIVENAPTIFVEETNKSLAEIFRKNLTEIGAKCEIVENRTQAVSLIEKIATEKKAKRIAISDSELVAEIVREMQSEAQILTNATKEILFETDLGITSAQFGIAETGTLVIESDKEFNRLTSLVPPVHICVLETGKIRQTLGEVLSELEKDLSRSITFITGQSRTSDIELTLALGVHGPGELFVVLIEEI